MSDKTDTPRTDHEAYCEVDGTEVVYAIFARQLERELAEARKDTISKAEIYKFVASRPECFASDEWAGIFKKELEESK